MSDAWAKLRSWTLARIGLERKGHALCTRDWLEFQGAHALARDSVLRTWDYKKLGADLNALGVPNQVLRTRAQTRGEFLLRPDLGRRLAANENLNPVQDLDLALVVSDGLSARAIENEFLPFWKEFSRALPWSFSPLLLVPFGRVAVADEIGEKLGAKASLIFIGERPGLSTPASMGIYLTYGPRVGNHDAQRNCLSNIHAHGMSSVEASEKTKALLRESLRLKLSGVGLKETAPKLVGDV